jgi:hypothetical protein
MGQGVVGDQAGLEVVVEEVGVGVVARWVVAVVALGLVEVRGLVVAGVGVVMGEVGVVEREVACQEGRVVGVEAGEGVGVGQVGQRAWVGRELEVVEVVG